MSASPPPPEVHIREATSEQADADHVRHMARLAATHPVSGREPDQQSVESLLPLESDTVLLALHPSTGERLGAAWTHWHQPPLFYNQRGAALPEAVIAVKPEARGQGAGSALLAALQDEMRQRASALCLNVHLLNPAIALYVRSGFVVAGAGRGDYGVAMCCQLNPYP